MKDLFGEDDSDDGACGSSGMQPPRLPCYITRRVANGYARQYNDKKKGTYYIDLKIYDSNEVEKITPMNRWRQAIISIKTRADNTSEAWRHLSKYVKETRAEYKSFPPTSFNYNTPM